MTPFGAPGANDSANKMRSTKDAIAFVLRKANYKDVYGLVLKYCHNSRDTHATGTQTVGAKMTSLDGSFPGEKLFHEREASERVERDLFPPQRIASSDVILALTICDRVCVKESELQR